LCLQQRGRFYMAVWNEWTNNVKGYNRNVRLFLWANFFFQIGMGMFMIMYNLYIRALGYDQVMLGNIIAMTSFAAAIILIPAGLISDRVGRKKVIVLGLLLTVVSFGLRSIIEFESGLIATAFMTGMFSAFIQVSAIPFLSENSTKEQRVHLFSFNFALMMVANVIGNIGGGALSDFFHLFIGFSDLISLRITLLIGTLISLISLLPVLLIHEKRKSREKGKASFNFKVSFQANKQSLKIIGLFAVAQMFIGFGAGLVIPYLNIYFSDRFDASNTSIGFVLALGQAATAIAMFIGPLIVRRLGDVKSVVVLQLCSIPFLLITGFTNNYYLASTGFLFRQALMNAGNPIQMSIMMDKVEDSMKGLANSVGQMVFMLGWAVMGPVSTAIVAAYGSYWGYAYVFSITAVLYIAGSVYFYMVFAPKKKINQESRQNTIPF
jgi:MFS family permease